MAGSMKDIKLRIKSVESTMQITKAMELVASSKMRRAKERVEHSRPYFETLHETLTGIAAADPRARSPYLRRDEIRRTLLIVIAGDRGLAGGYNSNVLKQAEAQQGPVTVLPIGKRSAEYFAHHEADLFTDEVLLAAEISVGECFSLSRKITEGFLKGDYDAVKICYTRFDSMMTQTAATMEVLPLSIERGTEGSGPPQPDPVQAQQRGSVSCHHPRICRGHRLRCRVRERGQRAGRPPHRHGRRDQECGRNDRPSESVLQPRPSGCHHAGDHRDRGRRGDLTK